MNDGVTTMGLFGSTSLRVLQANIYGWALDKTFSEKKLIGTCLDRSLTFYINLNVLAFLERSGMELIS